MNPFRKIESLHILLIFVLVWNSGSKASEAEVIISTSEATNINDTEISSTEGGGNVNISNTTNSTTTPEPELRLWDSKKTAPKNDLTINSSCTVVTTETTRNLANGSTVPFTIVNDNCPDEPSRKFMHCNPITNLCECYRDWGYDSPNYADPEWNTIPEWFEWEKESEECVVKSGMKCGSITGASPYQCKGKSRCVDVKKEDRYLLFCNSNAVDLSSTLNFLLYFIIISINVFL